MRTPRPWWDGADRRGTAGRRRGGRRPPRRSRPSRRRPACPPACGCRPRRWRPAAAGARGGPRTPGRAARRSHPDRAGQEAELADDDGHLVAMELRRGRPRLRRCRTGRAPGCAAARRRESCRGVDGRVRAGQRALVEDEPIKPRASTGRPFRRSFGQPGPHVTCRGRPAGRCGRVECVGPPDRRSGPGQIMPRNIAAMRALIVPCATCSTLAGVRTALRGPSVGASVPFTDRERSTQVQVCHAK